MGRRILACTLVLVLGLTACAKAPATPGMDWTYSSDHILELRNISSKLPYDFAKADRLRVGIVVAEPAAFRYEGRLIGYDIDFAKALGKVLGLQVEFVEITAAQLGSKEQFDIAMAPVGTAAKLPAISYLTMGTGFAIRHDNQAFTVVDGLCGRHIGVLAGSAQVEELPKISSQCQHPIKVTQYETAEQLRGALNDGSVELMAGPSVLTQASSRFSGGAIVQFTGVREARPAGVIVANQEIAVAVHEAMQYLMDRDVWQAIGARWGIQPSLLNQALAMP